MPATVYFATNRVIQGDAGNPANYRPDIVDPQNPAVITYGTAFVDTAGSGAISQIVDITEGRFSDNAIGDLSTPGRHLMVFLHGFDYTFNDAITQAAVNQQWLEAGGGNYAMIAFSWPSLGDLIDGIDLTGPYRHDQNLSVQSGRHIMSFFANILPLAEKARSSGQRVNLLCHSMGNWALQAAVQSWFQNGQGNAALFDATVLAAADEVYDSFSQPVPERLSCLHNFSERIRIYFNTGDQILGLSRVINGAQRLGQHGAQNFGDTSAFPTSVYSAFDCSAISDYADGFLNSHQYYHLSPTVRGDIAAYF